MSRTSATLHAPATLALLLSVLMALSPALLWAQAAPRPAASAPSAISPAVPAARPSGSGKELVAVMDLEAVGASKVEASAITDRLREELLKSGRFTLVDRTQMSAVLDEQALQQSGCTTQECAVQVGKVLGVHKLISGKVTKISDTAWLVNATVVDVETSETLRAESIRHRGDYFSMLDEAIVQLAAKISTPAGQKPDLSAYVAAQKQAPPAALPPPPRPPELKPDLGSLVAAQQAEPPRAKDAAPPAEQKDEPSDRKTGISKWWWVAGGAAVLGAAAAAGGSSKKSSASGCGNCGNVNLSW
jgi:TolB-like protein